MRMKMFGSVEDVEKATEEGVVLLSVQNAIFARKRDISQTCLEIIQTRQSSSGAE